MVSCGMKVIRYLLFAFNLIFALSGIIILAIGATILALHHGVGLLVGSIWWVPAMFIVLGSIIFIISSLGCCGAIRNNNIMMKSFALLLIALLVLEVVVGVVSYVMRTEVEQFLHEKLNASLSSYTTNQQIEDGWNIVQHDFSCCGVNGPQDWDSVFHNATLPGVCCPDMSVDEQCTMSRPQHSTQGCFDTIKAILTNRGIIITSVVSAVAMIQAIGVILACCLARAFRDDYETV